MGGVPQDELHSYGIVEVFEIKKSAKITEKKLKSHLVQLKRKSENLWYRRFGKFDVFRKQKKRTTIADKRSIIFPIHPTGDRSSKFREL